MNSKDAIKKDFLVKKDSNLLPPPFHLFSIYDHYFLFDTTGGLFYQIEKIAYRFLELALDNPINVAKSIMIREGEYTFRQINEVYKNISLMEKNGLFDCPNFYTKDSQNDLIAEKIGQSEWTSIQLVLTNQCNLACKYCYCSRTNDFPLKKEIMSQETLRKSIELLFKKSGTAPKLNIVFFGGEPLLQKALIIYGVKYGNQLAKQYGKEITFSMTTNGVLVDDEIIKVIKDNKFAVMVSLDGDEEKHNSQCPTHCGEGSYSQAVQGLKKLLENGCHTEIRCTMTHPMGELKKLLESFYSFNCQFLKRIVIEPAYNPIENPSSYDFQAEDYKTLIEQERKLLPWMLSTMRGKESPKYIPYSPTLAAMSSHPFTTTRLCNCEAGYSSIGIDPSGNIFPCVRFGGMSQWVLGHISSAEEISNKVKEFWKKYRHTIIDKCGSCWAFAICNGPCAWDIVQSNGCFLMTDRHCKRRISQIENSAYIFATQKNFAEQVIREYNKDLENQPEIHC